MALYDCNTAGTHSEIGSNVYDCNTAGTHSALKEMYDCNTAGVHSLAWKPEIQATVTDSIKWGSGQGGWVTINAQRTTFGNEQWCYGANTSDGITMYLAQLDVGYNEGLIEQWIYGTAGQTYWVNFAAGSCGDSRGHIKFHLFGPNWEEIVVWNSPWEGWGEYSSIFQVPYEKMGLRVKYISESSYACVTQCDVVNVTSLIQQGATAAQIKAVMDKENRGRNGSYSVTINQ